MYADIVSVKLTKVGPPLGVCRSEKANIPVFFGGNAAQLIIRQ